jgi:hypothetical protein
MSLGVPQRPARHRLRHARVPVRRPAGGPTGEFPDANVVRVEIDFESQALGDVLPDRLIGEPVTFGVHPEEYDFFLGRHGFRIVDLALASELKARYAPNTPAAVDDSLYVLAAERIGAM